MVAHERFQQQWFNHAHSSSSLSRVSTIVSPPERMKRILLLFSTLYCIYSNAVQVNIVNVFNGIYCLGSPVSSFVFSLVECTSDTSNISNVPGIIQSFSFSCGVFNEYATRECLGNPSLSLPFTGCFPDSLTDQSLQYACNKIDVVNLTYATGNCSSSLPVFSLIAEVGVCQRTDGTTTSDNSNFGLSISQFNESWLIEDEGNALNVKYFYTGNCTGTPIATYSTAFGNCSETIQSNGQFSSIVVAQVKGGNSAFSVRPSMSLILALSSAWFYCLLWVNWLKLELIKTWTKLTEESSISSITNIFCFDHHWISWAESFRAREVIWH